MDTQDERIESLDVVKDIEDILPLSFQKKLPKTTFRFKLLYYGIKLIVKLRRFKNKLFARQKETRQLIEKNYKDKQLKTITWRLTREETKNLIQNCKKYKVSVHSAICTLFLADFPIINNPVNVRGRLAYDVGEAVGLFASGILIKQKYDEKKSFWTSAKKYNRKLRKKLKGTEVFKIYRSFSRAVSLESIEKLGPLFLELASENKPFAVTNLGSLDKLGINTISEKHSIKELYGGVSGTMDAISVVAFTINEQLHMHFQYYDPSYTLEESKKYVENAKNMLDRALNE
jgi:hypothetical protein